MKKLSMMAITTLLLGLSGAALSQSYICITKPSTRFIDDKTVFVCTGGIPNMRVKDMNQLGYRIVSIAVNNFVDGDYNYTDWAIVIEK